MTTTREEIQKWLNEAPEEAAFMIVMCDTFDWVDYPVYVPSGKNPRKHWPEPMQKVMECYDLSLDLDEQLKAPRALNWGPSHD